MLKPTLSLLLLLCLACSATRAQAPTLEPLALETASSRARLEANHFARDRAAVGEAELREILAAPVYLEENARLGVVPVASRYEPSDAVPVDAAPAVLADGLETSGLFELSSEISTEWPVDRGLPGLRELAARYRTEYLVLYRHRFSDARSLNPRAALYVTLLGMLLPGTTLDTAGVLEATLYDVKTGTILFTVHERVEGRDAGGPVSLDDVTQALHRRLVKEGAPRLVEQVLGRCRKLAASRPAGGEAPKQAVVAAPPR